MNAIEEAILRTVLYADVFDFPMTAYEIAHFLIADHPISRTQIDHTLQTSSLLHNRLTLTDSYVCWIGREAIITTRINRESASEHLWQPALRYGRWFGYLPFVRMVALTGALAMRNATPDDDLDYVLVTTPKRVWIARAFAVMLVRVMKLRGVTLCPNYVLAENALEQGRRDLYTAHEVAQMIPVYGGMIYDQMRALNTWVAEYLPNAHDPFYDNRYSRIHAVALSVKCALEMSLHGGVGDALEHWEHRRKVRRFSSAMQNPHSAAVLDESQVKGHFEDHGHPVLIKYQARLRDCDLLERLPLAGD